jgi:hypothetical protein
VRSKSSIESSGAAREGDAGGPAQLRLDPEFIGACPSSPQCTSCSARTSCRS